MKNSPFRNAQFEKIRDLKARFKREGKPIISIDTKKKENLGLLFREGWLYTQETIEVFDHDFASLREGVVIPYGIYDLLKNSGYLILGTSHDTAEFVGECLWIWWEKVGKKEYPTVDELLILADGGGSNPARGWLFKEALQKFADKSGLKIRIAHYPPYTSKWNPIEHRLFPHITRSLQGIILRTYGQVKTLIERTKTKTGLKVGASILEKVFQLGRKSTQVVQEKIKVLFDFCLGQWNYTITPSYI